MTEVFKKVYGYGGKYEVSNKGTVKSFYNAGRILKTEQIKNGYLRVKLCKNKLETKYLAHRLVAYAFLGAPPKDKPFVNHKDGNKTNNCVNNLEYVSAQENTVHAFNTGLNENPKGVEHPNNTLTEQQVLEIRDIRETTTLSLNNIARMFGVSKGCISGIVYKRTWKHL